MQTSPLLEQLIEALKILPGVGPKSAQRMAYHLLQHNRLAGDNLGKTLIKAMHEISHCSSCRTLCENDLCIICQNQRRINAKTLCVVEMPADINVIEQTGQFSGLYFVLMGRLSPIDGIGPNELGLDHFEQKLADGDFQEVIIATNPTVEGDASANYIAQICAKYDIKATRLAHGIPVGGDIENIDGTTLLHSFIGRHKIL